MRHDHASPSGGLIGLQYLRGLAAVMVVVDHLNIQIGLPKYFSVSPISVDLHAGAAGVNLFFVISGFIIAFVSLERSAQGIKSRVSLGNFLYRRFARIVPFLWICVLSYAALRFVGRNGAFDFYPYLRAFFLYPTGTVNPTQVWTLRHELLFYLIFSTVILFERYRFVGICAWFILPVVYLPFAPIGSNEMPEIIRFACSPFNILFGFGFGLSILYLRFPGLFSYRIKGGMLLCGALCAFYVLLYPLIDYSHENLGKVLITGVAAATIVGLAVCLPNPARSTPDHLGKILGDASYSIYLTHGGFISAVLGAWAAVSLNYVSAVFFVTFIIAVALGVFTHYTVELPVVRLFHQRAVKGPVVST
jgi:exopolysaccharide production protein ExoZ